MNLEDRKLKEIEHSDKRRSIVKGFEYKTDTTDQEIDTSYIKLRKEYQEHFSNMKFYSISGRSFAYRDKCLFKNVLKQL